MIRIAFRLDDPSRTSDQALERQILGCFADAGMSLTAAVVPFTCADKGEPVPLSRDVVPHLDAACGNGTLEVALHGYCHRSHAVLADGNHTEFAGIDTQQQREALVNGKACLEAVFGGAVEGFVPPWNSYDATTLGLLREVGFAYLSADWALVTQDALPLPVLPHTCHLVHVETAVEEARRYPACETLIVVILHHYDFRESGSAGAGFDIARLATLLGRLKQHEDIEVNTLAESAKRVDCVACRENLVLAHWRSRQHWRFQQLFPRQSLLSAGGLRFRWAVARGALQRLPRAISA